MTAKLSKAQREALLAASVQNEHGRHYTVQYPVRRSTMNALRRLGLVECTIYAVTKAWFADEKGFHRQDGWCGTKYEWWVRPAGRLALSEEAE